MYRILISTMRVKIFFSNLETRNNLSTIASSNDEVSKILGKVFFEAWSLMKLKTRGLENFCRYSQVYQPLTSGQFGKIVEFSGKDWQFARKRQSG